MSGITVPKESQIRYLRRRLEEIAKIRGSLEGEADWDLIKKMGHQIKGNAATFGFTLLAEYGRDLEIAAVKQDPRTVRELNAQLETDVQNLLRALEAAS